ncbi:MAG: hypothetical protein M3014_02490 [Chloroflexota bacterium]|nr:hypothetical protein [Chloroflexota bacterium]
MESLSAQPAAVQVASQGKTGTQKTAVFWTLCRFFLSDFSRTGWVLLPIIILAGVHTLFFSQYRSDQTHFFGIEYSTMLLLAAITTAVLFARANRAETYAILAKPVSRVVLTGAILFASWLIVLLCHIVSTAIEWLRFGPLFAPPGAPDVSWRTPLIYAEGTLAVMVAAAFSVALVALLSSFVSPPGVRLSMLVILAALVMSFDNRNFPIESLRPIFQQFPPVLAPLAGALKYATQSPPDSVAIISLAMLAGYTFLLIVATLLTVAGRDLVLD